MDLREIVALVKSIREDVSKERYSVERLKKKQPDWKNKLLELIADDTVLNHLMYLQPFQYRESTDTKGTHVFSINVYKYNIYLKVNTLAKTVVSFHYDEIPFEQNGEISTSFYDEDELFILCDEVTGNIGKFSIAVGSEVLTPEVRVGLVENNVYSIEPFVIRDVLNEYCIRLNGRLKRSLYSSKVIDKKTLQGVQLDFKELSFLSHVFDDYELQQISYMFDLLHSDQDQWVKDIAGTALSLIPPKLLNEYKGQLYPGKSPNTTNEF